MKCTCIHLLFLLYFHHPNTEDLHAFNFQICKLESPEMKCDPKSPYRSLSGRCNNLENPTFGKHIVPLRRIFPAQYDDGVSRPRIRSKSGRSPLPNVRKVSQSVHHDGSNLDSR